MDPRITLASGVLTRLRAESAASGRPASDPALLSLLAVPVPSQPCRPVAFVADGANRPARADFAIPGLVADVAPNVAPGALPPHLQSVRYSIAHVEPMRASGPSTARVAEYRRAMRGEGMAVEAHLFDGPSPPAPSGEGAGDSGGPPPLASLAPPLSRKEPLGGMPDSVEVFNCFRDFALDADAGDGVGDGAGEAAAASTDARPRRAAEWWSRGAALSRGPSPDQPELLVTTMLFPPGEREASAAVTAELGEGMAASVALTAGGPLPLPLPHHPSMGPVGEQLGAGGRDYEAADVVRFRAHYEAIGQEAAAAVVSAPRESGGEGGRAVPAATTTTSSSASFALPRRALYQPESAAALASLAAFRFGLQEMERHRRRRNAALARDPAGGWGELAAIGSGRLLVGPLAAPFPNGSSHPLGRAMLWSERVQAAAY